MHSEKMIDMIGQEEIIEQDLGQLVSQEEHETSKWQAIKRNPTAFAWCLFAVWTILLASFENQASGNILSIPQFRKDFGYSFEGNYVLPAKWQSAFSAGPVASQVVGALGAAQIADLIGRRYTLMGAIAVSFVAVTLEFIATTNPMFFGGKFLNGFAVGTIQTVAYTYIGEIAPLALRGIMTCLIALSFTVGPFTFALIINSTGQYDSRWAYRAVFCAQYGFAGLSAIPIWMMPESPWWLATKGNDDKALRSLRRLGYQYGDEVKRLANIKFTLQQVRRETDGVTYAECFRKSNLRRTIISIAPLSIQAFTGVAFVGGYFTYYAQLAGYSTSMSFKLLIIQQILAMFGNCCSWYLVDKIGRRALTLYGTIVLTVVLWITGGLAVGGSKLELRGTLATLLIYSCVYNGTLGATGFTILTEVSTSRLRVKTIAIGIAIQSSWYVMWSFALPYLFNPDKANLGGKVGFIFGGLSILCIAYLWYFQPETSGRSYEELDDMFVKRLSARKFGSYRAGSETAG